MEEEVKVDEVVPEAPAEVAPEPSVEAPAEAAPEVA